MRRFITTILVSALGACSYPMANPGEPDDSEVHGERSGAAVQPGGVIANLVNLKCDCHQLIAENLRSAYGQPSNAAGGRQLDCSYVDPANDENDDVMSVEAARVISRALFERILAKKKQQIPLVLKEVYSDEPIGDAEAKIIGSDGDHNVSVMAYFRAHSGHVVVMTETVSKKQEAPKPGASLRMINILDNLSTHCEE